MKRMMRGLGIVLFAIPALCQAPAGRQQKFEVATIKPTDPGQRGSKGQVQPGGRVVISGMSVRDLITTAYRVRDFQISGGPGWVGTDRWDIEARTDEGAASKTTESRDPNAPGPMEIRLQSLLEDRFKLKIHRETKDLPVYELSIAKNGPKIKLSKDQSLQPEVPGAPGSVPRGGVRTARNRIIANAVPVSILAAALARQLGRTVVDKTGLQGLYDLQLQWSPDAAPPAGPATGPEPPPPDESGPSIFTAVQEELGLRLGSARGPVDTIVIDSIEKPSQN